MATITSSASGNFNVGATWVGGVSPTAADTAVAATGHTITITANATCVEVTNAGTGTYILNPNVTLTANVTNKSSTTSVTCLTFSSATPATANIVGNCTLNQAGSVVGICSVANTGTGTLTITGNVSSVGLGYNTSIVNNTSTGTINITGNVSSANNTNGVGVNNAVGGIVNITGNLYGGVASGIGGIHAVNNPGVGTINVIGSVFGSSLGSSVYGINNNSTGTITVIGDVTASLSAGINNASTGPVTITGTLTSSNNAFALSCTNTTGATIILSGSLISSSNGNLATNCAKFRMSPNPLNAKTRYALSGSGTYVDMYTADNTSGITGVATTDVRLGVSYGGGLVGTCNVPPAGSVALGVPVDNTTGTATLTAANLRAALGMASANLDTQLAVLSNLDATVSSRLAPSGTLATVTTLTNSPNVPSAAAIASQVRTELTTELGRLDATVSSRLATSAYTAASTAPTAAQNAAAVRTELATELARVDAAVSTRLASSAYTAPSNSDVAAIKAKTDLLETTRLAACSTVATTGAQLAAALS